MFFQAASVTAPSPPTLSPGSSFSLRLSLNTEEEDGPAAAAVQIDDEVDAATAELGEDAVGPNDDGETYEVSFLKIVYCVCGRENVAFFGFRSRWREQPRSPSWGSCPKVRIYSNLCEEYCNHKAYIVAFWYRNTTQNIRSNHVRDSHSSGCARVGRDLGVDIETPYDRTR